MFKIGIVFDLKFFFVKESGFAQFQFQDTY